MTYRQKKLLVNQALRRFKKFYRASDTMGERLERELKRLILRKELVEPASLRKTVEITKAYVALAAALSRGIIDLVNIATS